MIGKNILLINVLIAVMLFSCSDKQSYHELGNIAEDIRLKYVPDRRDNVFDIEVKDVGGKPVLKGVTTVVEAKNELLELAHAKNESVIDNITLLPDAVTLGKTVYGVINVSVADLRMKGSFSSEMASQMLLGHPVEVLQHQDWWRVKSPEGYVAWTTGTSFVPMDKDEFNKWIAAPKIIFTDIYGFGYSGADEKMQTVSDLVFGNLLKLEGEQGRFYKVAYPDGKVGYILKNQAQPYEKWLASVNLTEESILQKAKTLMGIPYTWGGTSVKAMDCSGFSKTVMLMHGIILMRDASQQVHTGTPVDITEGYGNLRKGDLMFFGKKADGEKKERVRHVGFYMGNNEFIHAAGYVKIGSLDSTKTNYDELNTREFIRASRVIGAVDTRGIWSIQNRPLYKEQK